MRTCLLIPTVLSLALVASHSPDASANTKYHFSGASCQPERASDVALALTDGGGITNTDNAAFPAAPIRVTCPVSGTESASLTQVDLSARIFDGSLNNVLTFWQANSQFNNVMWYSSVKFPCAANANGCATAAGFTGNAFVRWNTAAELFGTLSGFGTYAFRAEIPGRCLDQCGTQSWVQAYWTEHVQR